jgi:5-methylcytosine-specific restriction endonuclease McrA
MKKCPKCNIDHEKSGRFCSRACANSRVFSDSAIEKKRNKTLTFWSQFDEAGRKEHNKQKIAKYDRESADKKGKETRLKQSWSRPYEEMARGSLRKRLLIERNHTCEDCGIGNTHNGKPLSLELDHIDGNSNNNKVENLRILCPNCHSQTPTHRAKNIKYKRLLLEKSIGI